MFEGHRVTLGACRNADGSRVVRNPFLSRHQQAIGGTKRRRAPTPVLDKGGGLLARTPIERDLLPTRERTPTVAQGEDTAG